MKKFITLLGLLVGFTCLPLEAFGQYRTPIQADRAASLDTEIREAYVECVQKHDGDTRPCIAILSGTQEGTRAAIWNNLGLPGGFQQGVAWQQINAAHQERRMDDLTYTQRQLATWVDHNSRRIDYNAAVNEEQNERLDTAEHEIDVAREERRQLSGRLSVTEARSRANAAANAETREIVRHNDQVLAETLVETVTPVANDMAEAKQNLAQALRELDEVKKKVK